MTEFLYIFTLFCMFIFYFFQYIIILFLLRYLFANTNHNLVKPVKHI